MNTYILARKSEAKELFKKCKNEHEDSVKI